MLIPDHYDNWANTASDPELLVNQFERIVRENTPEIRTCILRQGARFTYPDQADMGRYRYPNQSDKYNAVNSQTYGEMARKYQQMNEKK